MPDWLLEQNVYDEMEAARTAGIVPTAEQLATYDELISAANTDMPRIMSVVGSNAAIDIVGVLTDAPSWMARWFGGGNTTYREIRSALAMADADPAIDRIMLQFNSPGGQASSEMLETINAVKSTKKPVDALVGDMAASAAYAIAAQSDKIIAQNDMTKVGSVGIVHTSVVSDRVIDVTSSNAPKKRPDASTKAGKAVIRETIDAMEKVFIDSIAEGRDTTAKAVKSDFGQGAVVLASEAVERNMIDEISAEAAKPTQRATAATATETTTASGGNTTEESIMDKTELMAKFPAIYQAAVEDGVAKERDRVNAHLILGKTGDMEAALEAVEKGEEMSATVQAKHIAAAMGKNDLAARDADDAEANAGEQAAEPKEAKEDESAQVTANVIAAMAGGSV